MAALGEDSVVYIGGDQLNDGTTMNDHVAVRYNRLLGRYEISALVWDINNERFIASTSPEDLIQGDFLRRWHFYETLERGRNGVPARCRRRCVSGKRIVRLHGRSDEFAVGLFRKETGKPVAAR